MPFLLPNRQRQSTEGPKIHIVVKIVPHLLTSHSLPSPSILYTLTVLPFAVSFPFPSVDGAAEYGMLAVMQWLSDA